MKNILKSTKEIYEDSKHVTTNKQKLKDICGTLRKEHMEHWLSASPFDTSNLDDDDKLNFLLTFNSLSFSYWGNPKWTVEYRNKKYDSSWALITSLQRALEEKSPILDPAYREFMTRKDLEYLLRGNLEIPLLDERLKIIKEIAKVTNKKYQGDFAKLLKKANYDALKIVDKMTSEVTAFNDVTTYKNKPVYFYKKAQLFVSDVYNMFKGKGYGDIKNIDKLTALADYKIPQILRELGIFEYSKSLKEKIDNLIEIPKDSIEEIEIRANTIWTVELMKQKLQKNNPDISTMDINDHLWLLSQEKTKGDKPYHRTRTTYY